MTCRALGLTVVPLRARSIQLLHSPANWESFKAGFVVERDVVLLHPGPRASGVYDKALGKQLKVAGLVRKPCVGRGLAFPNLFRGSPIDDKD